MIEQTGYFGSGDLTQGQWTLLNTNSDDGMKAAVGIVKAAFSKWGIENTLAFVRQGRSGFDPQKTNDWRSFVGGNAVLLKHVEGYLSAIKTYLQYIDNNPSLFWDDHRPDIYCEWI